MDTYIYVQAQDGTPLMPTRRHRHVQKLLRQGKARVVEHVPFVIRLKYAGSKNVQPLYGGTDPGRTNIENAVIDGKGNAVYKDHVTTRNKDVAKLMTECRQHRQASRRGERFARKRLAKRLGTTSKRLLDRILPGCGEPVRVKDIINTEARFANRKRPAGWTTPTVRQLVQTHANMVRRIRKILPVDTWTMELNSFAFMSLDDEGVRGKDFQNGPLKGFRDEKDYVRYILGGRCLCCGKKRIDHFHHIVPKSRGGSDRWYNLGGVCEECHAGIHTGKTVLSSIGTAKRFAGTSVLNQAVPFIASELEKEVTVFHTCTGRDMKDMRALLSVERSHADDAVCIAAYGSPVKGISDTAHTYEVKQYRRHDRQLINSQRERTYYAPDGTGYGVIAKNRRPRFEQKGPSLDSLGLTREQLFMTEVTSILRLLVKKGHYSMKGLRSRRCL